MTNRAVELTNDPKNEGLVARVLNLDFGKITIGDKGEISALDKSIIELIVIVKGTHPDVPDKLMKVYPFDHIAPAGN